MRKLILSIAISLDGYIEGPNGEFDWCFVDNDYGMLEFFDSIDAILMGRISYQLITNLNKNPYPDVKKYVCSTTLSNLPGNTQVISEDMEIQVAQLKMQEGKDIWLLGGAQLACALINANLLDEIRLSVHPVLLGGGYPLFLDIKQQKNFKLVDAKTYTSGLVQLVYEL